MAHAQTAAARPLRRQAHCQFKFDSHAADVNPAGADDGWPTRMDAMSAKIAVDELRVGMFVHLDLGWWAHPFALSSFKLTSPDQITTIRSLGLTRVRWSPDKSALDGYSDAPLAPVAANDEAVAEAPSISDQEPAAPATPDAKTLETGAPEDAGKAARDKTKVAQGACKANGSENASAAPRAHERRMQLAAQREATRVCARQYGEAAKSLKAASDGAFSQPEASRVAAEGLTRALLDKMLVDGELCIRVLAEARADRATAHALNVTVISLLMGRVFGFNEQEMLDVGVGALLHDVGKLELPDRVRQPDLHAAPADQALYREHVMRGVAIGKRMGLNPGALLVIGQHHEMADGSGFPNKLSVDRMHAAARIVALVNRYDNLCDPALPAHALTPHEALSLIFAQTRSKFDASMLNAFIRMMGVYPPGSVVQLTDDRFALVTHVNSTRPLKPRVLVFDPQMPSDEALHLNLEQHADLGIRRSLRAQQLPDDALHYLSPQQRVIYFFEPALPPRSDFGREIAA
jgi:putative nucleotidyltransferase with HDIG domain